MKRWAVGGIAVGLLLTGCSGSGAGTDAGDTTPSESTASPSTAVPTPGADAAAAAWSATIEPPFTADLPNKGANPIAAGDVVVVLTLQGAAAYDVATGEPAWATALPEEVCASSRQVNDDGVVAVLMGSDGECSRAAAMDTTDGKLLWDVPIPAAAESFGHQVAVGPHSVVVTGECTGFSVLDIGDGAVTASVRGENVERRCASAASDGTTAVLSSRGTISTYHAATGDQQSTWPAKELGRIGDVLTQDPLVVTGRFSSGGRLIDLSGAQPRQYGRDEGGYGGEPAASVRVGGTLWVQYDDSYELVGYDLTSRQESGTVLVGTQARLAGTHDDRLVVTVGNTSPQGVELWLVDPAAPADPEVVGLLPRPDDEGGALAGSVVVGDHLVRLWPGRVEAFTLP